MVFSLLCRLTAVLRVISTIRYFLFPFLPRVAKKPDRSHVQLRLREEYGESREAEDRTLRYWKSERCKDAMRRVDMVADSGRLESSGRRGQELFFLNEPN